MRKRILLLGLIFTLLSGCAAQPAAPKEENLTIVATTYPIYLFVSAVTEGVDGVKVERLNTGSVSCLHDYTLSMTDMKKLEKADAIALNGAGLEEFMEDALATSDAAVIDCSQDIPLLENLSHHHEEESEEDDHGHDHGHWDPHYWLDPENAGTMVENLARQLTALDPENGPVYDSNKNSATVRLRECGLEMRRILSEDGANIPGLITFHDGFQYFASAFNLPLLEAIEEEAGSEASAREIVEITQLVKEHQLPVIFTEYNGSDATAKAIARETGCQVAQLSMIMDGEESHLDAYINAQIDNIKAVRGGFEKEAAAK